MSDKQTALDRIASLKSELKEAQKYFEDNYGLSESEGKIINFLKSRKGRNYSSNDIARGVRDFGSISKAARTDMLSKMVNDGVLRSEIIPTFSGRGRPKTAYFLLEQE